MAWATGFYGLTWEKMVENSAAVDIDGDTIKKSLHTNTGTPNFETHDFQDDLTNEVGNSGTYAAGGSALASVTSGIAAGVYTLDAADTAWTGATITARGDAHSDTTPGAAGSNWLILARTFGSDFTSTAGTFTVVENASGIWTAAYR